jgi:uncharacterized membrane protein (UPF0127 family)
VLVLAGISCDGGRIGQTAGKNRNDLATMDTTQITINGHKFQVWIARTPRQQELGLMQVAADEMNALPDQTERGMLFVFPEEQRRQFWMKDTIIPLDIAFMRSDGQIVKVHTMAPLETRLYPSVMPALMALEVNAGVLHKLGIAEGDKVEIPESVLKAGAS